MSLTAEQELIAQASPNAKLLVTAGPGTGKTHTLITRLTALVENYGISPGGELLVLSFSRAAVREIRSRVEAVGGDTAYVRAQTFDSFATRLLADHDSEGTWTSRDYEGRILEATQLIGKSEAACDEIQSYAHILIDEVQDLVGVRDDLVRAVLQAAEDGPGGWTLLGDPAQGIYTFQLEGEARKIGAAALYSHLKQTYSGLQKHSLTQNHRAESAAAKKLAATLSPFGQKLNADLPNYSTIRHELDDVILGLTALQAPQHGATQAALKAPLRTAILCRTNGESLLLSRYLHEREVPHVVQRSATDRVVPLWVAELFWDWTSSKIGKNSFVERCVERLGDDEASAVEKYRALSRLGSGNSRDGIELDVLGERIRSGNVPDQLCEQREHTLTISTIHRAKGLEFERVVLLWDEQKLGSEADVDLEEETRLLYVGLTRPRRTLYRMPFLTRHGWWLCSQNPSARWTRKFFQAGPLKYRICDWEVVGSDVHSLDPAGGFLISEADAVAVQSYIQAKVRPDDLVVLERVETMNSEGRPRSHWIIKHEGQVVGITSEEFWAGLYSALKRNSTWKIRWPDRIEGLRVECVDTVAGSGASGEQCGLGPLGLWRRVRVSGMGKLCFDRTDEE